MHLCCFVGCVWWFWFGASRGWCCGVAACVVWFVLCLFSLVLFSFILWGVLFFWVGGGFLSFWFGVCVYFPIAMIVVLVGVFVFRGGWFESRRVVGGGWYLEGGGAGLGWLFGFVSSARTCFVRDLELVGN